MVGDLQITQGIPVHKNGRNENLYSDYIPTSKTVDFLFKFTHRCLESSSDKRGINI